MRADLDSVNIWSRSRCHSAVLAGIPATTEIVVSSESAGHAVARTVFDTEEVRGSILYRPP
jgi:hypothetical protein